GAAGAVVVAVGVNEVDGVAVGGHRVGVGGATEVQVGRQALAEHARGRARRRVAVAVVGHAIAADRDDRVGLVHRQGGVGLDNVVVADLAVGVAQRGA